MVYAALDDLMKSEIHALSINALVPNDMAPEEP
jgi:acid stress-induced BolA-like protein IbaG/YrbA